MTDDNDVDFVITSPVDSSDDEVLDAGPPRNDRRLIVGFVVAALVVVGVIVAVHSNDTPRPTAAPSTSSGPFGPVVPTFPSLTASPQPTPVTVDLGPQLCLPRTKCKHPATSARVRRAIRTAIRKFLGGVDNLRIRDSRLAAEGRAGAGLIAREITAHTPSGDLTVVAATIGSNDNVAVPIPMGSKTSLGAQTVIDDYAVGGSITLSGPHNGLRTLPRIDGLLNDRRLVANR